MNKIKLYTYYRSSAAYRVRIALNLKGLSYQPECIHLLKNNGENNSEEYRKLNPQGLIPTLVDHGIVINQSLAIIEYLEECYPTPSLLPLSPEWRARVRAFAQMICCDIHPLNNLRVLDYLKQEMEQDEAARMAWYRHWIAEGLMALERTLITTSPHTPFCFGDEPGMADACLIPQLYNAKRFECDIAPYPTLRKIYDNCMKLKPFLKAAPESQPDYEQT